MKRCRLLLLCALTCAPGAAGAAEQGATGAIVCPGNASMPEALAAKEIRRYVYLRTGSLLPIAEKIPPAGGGVSIVVASKDRAILKTPAADGKLAAAVAALKPQRYLLKTVLRSGRGTALIVGGDGVGTLYGADYMSGMSPWPKTPADCNELFNRVGAMLRDTFTFARRLGIRTCIGTKDRYKAARHYLKGRKFYAAIKAGGYATDPDYVDKLMGLYRQLGGE